MIHQKNIPFLLIVAVLISCSKEDDGNVDKGPGCLRTTYIQAKGVPLGPAFMNSDEDIVYVEEHLDGPNKLIRLNLTTLEKTVIDDDVSPVFRISTNHDDLISFIAYDGYVHLMSGDGKKDEQLIQSKGPLSPSFNKEGDQICFHDNKNYKIINTEGLVLDSLNYINDSINIGKDLYLFKWQHQAEFIIYYYNKYEVNFGFAIYDYEKKGFRVVEHKQGHPDRLFDLVRHPTRNSAFFTTDAGLFEIDLNTGTRTMIKPSIYFRKYGHFDISSDGNTIVVSIQTLTPLYDCAYFQDYFLMIIDLKTGSEKRVFK